MSWAPGVVAVASMVLSSCVGRAETERLPEEASPEAASPERMLHDESGASVIATLHTRDSELTVTAQGGSLSYSLVDGAGNARKLTLEELEAYDSGLYQIVRSATARYSARPGAFFVDARHESGSPAPRVSADRNLPRLAPRD